MGEPSALRPGKWQSRPMVRLSFVWATPCSLLLFVPQKMQFPEPILCLCKLITESSILPQGVSLVALPNAKASLATTKFLPRAL